MTDLMQTKGGRKQLYYMLLASVSSIALAVSTGVALARDADDSHPTFWIEISGAFDQLASDDNRWLAPNTPAQQSNPTPPFGTLPKVGYDTDLKLTVSPHDTEWKFSVGLVYGRSLRGHKSNHDQTYNTTNWFSTVYGAHKYFYTNANFANTQQRSTTSHLILDFQAGKDVGLGMLGGKSTLNVGIRWARLNEGASGHMSGATNANASAFFLNIPQTKVIADFSANHSFNGIGPSISWISSVPFAGSPSDELSFDWGANAALLFGKQKTRVNLHTQSIFYSSASHHEIAHYTQLIERNKIGVVSNVGGFAGISWRLPNAKISVGYKADFFFNAVDAGVYARETATRGFYGPFAAISIGLGG